MRDEKCTRPIRRAAPARRSSSTLNDYEHHRNYRNEPRLEMMFRMRNFFCQEGMLVRSRVLKHPQRPQQLSQMEI